MHIPDGFLSTGVAAACWVPTVAVARGRRAQGQRQPGRAARPAARRDRGVHLRRADAQLPGRRRHERPLPRRRPRGDAARPVARLPGDDRRHRRARRSSSPTAASPPSARTSSTWAIVGALGVGFGMLARAPLSCPRRAGRAPRHRRGRRLARGHARRRRDLARARALGHRAARHRAARDARRARADRRRRGGRHRRRRQRGARVAPRPRSGRASPSLDARRRAASSPREPDDAPLRPSSSSCWRWRSPSAWPPPSRRTPPRAPTASRRSRRPGVRRAGHAARDPGRLADPGLRVPGHRGRAPGDRRSPASSARSASSPSASALAWLLRRRDDDARRAVRWPVGGLCNSSLDLAGIAGDPASPVHRLDPRAKLVGFARPDGRRRHRAARRPGPCGSRAPRCSSLAAAVARVGPRAVWRRARLVLPLVLFVGAFVPFARGGEVVASLGPVRRHARGPRGAGWRRRSRPRSAPSRPSCSARRRPTRRCCAGSRRCACRAR